MPVIFAREPLTDALWEEAIPLLLAHWHEVSFYKDIPLEPRREIYTTAQENGGLRVFTARNGPALVGYVLFFITPGLHYASSKVATEDVIYLDPMARGTTGARLIAFCDAALQAEGVQVVTHHVKVAHNFGAMLTRMGYQPQDVIYTKRLDTPF